MKATLSNKTELTELDSDQYWQIRETLTFENPKYKEALQFGRSTWKIDQYIELFEDIPGGLRVPRGVSISVNFASVEDKRHINRVTIATNIDPRPYQERVIRLVTINQDGGVIVAPTGSGKTVMAIEIAARLGQRCLILVKSVDLAKQWQEAIAKTTGLDCGLIGGGQWQEGSEFTVCLIQTLIKHENSLNYGMVIVDECHNIPAAQAFAVINRQTAKYRFGLSATPQRRDNLEFMIHAALGPIIAEVEAHEVGNSVLPVSVATLRYDFKGTANSWSDFINQLENDETRNAMLVSKALNSIRITGTAILTTTVSHAETLHQLITQQGVDSLLLHGQLPKKERERRMQEAGNSQLIVGTLSLLSEGIDWPHIGSIIFATPVSATVDAATAKANRLLQSIGRARRPYPGKSKAFILDIVDSHPFGLASFKKRSEIYRNQGFQVR